MGHASPCTALHCSPAYRGRPSSIGRGEAPKSAAYTLWHASCAAAIQTAKDSVTSFLRAPFTHFEKPTGGGEVEESPRGTGMRHAVGELVTCPFCLGQWVASFFLYGLVLAPRLTRLIASTYAILTISDGLQLARDWTKKAV